MIPYTLCFVVKKNKGILIRPATRTQGKNPIIYLTTVHGSQSYQRSVSNRNIDQIKVLISLPHADLKREVDRPWYRY